MASTINEPVSGDDKKTKRKRNKKLLGSIRQQLEFYFSDANLRKDRFLKQEMVCSEDGYVDIATIASFNKMQVLCPDPALIPQAVGTSNLLVLNEDKTRLGRKVPLGEPEFDPDDVTVYVESIPKTTDHDWLRKVFGACGSVEYVSLPRYKTTGDIKGFAFIEFKTPEEANRACEMLHNPADDDTEKLGRFPKTVGRKYVPIEEKSDKHADDHQRDHDSPTDRKRSHRNDDSKRQQDNRGSHKRKRSDMEPADRPAESIKHCDTDSGQKRKHRDSESSDRLDLVTKHERKQQPSDKTSDAGTNQMQRKNKHEGQRSELDSSEKEHKQKQAKRDNLKDHGTVDYRIKTDSHNSSSQVSKSKDRESRKRTYADGESVAEGHGRKKNKLNNDSDHKSTEKESGEKERKRAENKGDNTKDRSNKAVPSKERESPKPKKRTHSDGDAVSKEHRGNKKSRKDHDSLDDERSKGHDLSSGGERSDGQEGEDQTRKESEKRRRARKKKQEKKKDSKEAELQLRVISKRDWLDLKKEYLSLQKASIAKLKRSLYQATVDSIAANDSKEKAMKATEPEFTAGVVLKIECKTPIESRKQLKDDLQSVAPVAYVDLQPGDQEGFVRCETEEGATQILSKYGAELKRDNMSVSLITGEDEKQYWDKLRTDRINKLNSKQKKKKKRGVNRVLSKAEKVSFSSVNKGNHVFFGDED